MGTHERQQAIPARVSDGGDGIELQASHKFNRNVDIRRTCGGDAPVRRVCSGYSGLACMGCVGALDGAQASEEPALECAALSTAVVRAIGLRNSFWPAGDVLRDRMKKKPPTPIATMSLMTATTVPDVPIGQMAAHSLAMGAQ